MRWEAPWMLFALALLPVLALLGARRPQARRAAVLWGAVGGAGARAGAWLVRAVETLPWIALSLALLALARPQQGLRLTETESRGVDIMLAIDMSPSMKARDLGQLTRLELAKQTAAEFIRRRPHDRIGLVGFAGTAFTQCPLTLDHDALQELLGGLDFDLAEDGTAIGMALATAVARLRESRTPGKVIVLLTDGANNMGEVDPLTGADMARAFGVKVYTILVGRGGLEYDPVTLEAIARRTSGRYYRATEANALAGIYEAIDRVEKVPVRSIVYRDYRDLAPALLAAAAALLALAALLSSTVAFRVP
jgi:Ca-activated chloride channel homolog